MRSATSSRFLSDLRNAIFDERPVTISYVTESGDHVVRTIEPYSIMKVESSGHHLIKAMDRERLAHRSFRLDRITAYTVAGHRSRFLINRPKPVAAHEIERGDWSEATYDPDGAYGS
jgi:predicted DNA-binding transcriptional regulator YafY